jgi:hypothetical protein
MRPAIAAAITALALLPALGCDVQVNSPDSSEPQGRPIRRHSRPAADADDDEERPAQNKKKKKGDDDKVALPPPEDCPTDLAVQPGPRTLDTRQAPTNSPRVALAKGHLNPPAEDFFLESGAAIDKVLAAEAKTPAMIPAGFRDQVKANPRDAALRLRMARCELDNDQTRRRASYDAGLALLLGQPKRKAMAILLESTKNGEKQQYVQTCGGGDTCPTGETCDPKHKECVGATKKIMIMMSAAELEVEDALTRGLIRPVIEAGEKANEQDLVWWAYKRVHRCGGGPLVMCNFVRYNVAGKGTVLVHWDLRYGGESGGPSEAVQEWYRKNCMRGSTTDCIRPKPSWVP